MVPGEYPFAGPLTSHPSSTTSDRSPNGRRSMNDPSPYREPVPVHPDTPHPDIAPFEELRPSDPAEHTVPVQMAHRRQTSGGAIPPPSLEMGMSRRHTAREKAKNWLIRPRRTPFGDYAGHALSEPIDTVKSLFSMFTTEALGSAILGTFVLGIATAINMNVGIDAISRVLAISFTFMLGIMVTIATDSKLSVNPAATLNALLLGKISVLRALVSIGGTHLGWLASAGLAKGIMGELIAEIGLAPNYSVSRAFAGELLATTGCLVTIFSTELEKGLHRPLAPLFIGSSFFLAHMLLVDKTGCSVNPARSLSPSIVNGHFPPHFWISQIPPYLAAFVSAGIVSAKKYILEKEADEKRDIDPDLVESDAPLGPEILLTNREIDRNIRHDARSMYAEARSQV